MNFFYIKYELEKQFFLHFNIFDTYYFFISILNITIIPILDIFFFLFAETAMCRVRDLHLKVPVAADKTLAPKVTSRKVFQNTELSYWGIPEWERPL